MNQSWNSDSFMSRHKFLCLIWSRNYFLNYILVFNLVKELFSKLHAGQHLWCETKIVLDCLFACFEFYWLQVVGSFWTKKNSKRWHTKTQKKISKNFREHVTVEVTKLVFYLNVRGSRWNVHSHDVGEWNKTLLPFRLTGTQERSGVSCNLLDCTMFNLK